MGSESEREPSAQSARRPSPIVRAKARARNSVKPDPKGSACRPVFGTPKRKCLPSGIREICSNELGHIFQIILITAFHKVSNLMLCLLLMAMSVQRQGEIYSYRCFLGSAEDVLYSLSSAERI
jgi:hypothetical protein